MWRAITDEKKQIRATVAGENRKLLLILNNICHLQGHFLVLIQKSNLKFNAI